MKSGIKPIPNIIIGFPEENFESIRNTVTALKELGIFAKPHFATAYPGSEWYNLYKDSILEQYEGDLEAYILDLGDATKITGIISHLFGPMELLGLQAIVHNRDIRNLDKAEIFGIHQEIKKSDMHYKMRPQILNQLNLQDQLKILVLK